VDSQAYAISPIATPRALAVYCGDPRFQEPIAKFLAGELGLAAGDYVPLVVAGGVASLMAGDLLPKEAKFVSEAIAMYLGLFASLDRVVLINHEDCGKYKTLARALPLFLRQREHTLADRQKQDLQHSAAALTADHGIAVESYYAAFSNPSRTLVRFEKQLWPT
jgi:hypothetical protein